ncbi:MAG: cupin domain-containing protein [Actinomycetota bacterium]
MPEVNGFTIENLTEFEEMEGSGECTWRLARKSLGVSSFGMNFVEIGPGGQIPEHDESERDHEEVFIVWEGKATAAVDGIEKEAPAGTFIRVAPEVRRTIRNDSDQPAKVLIVSAPHSSGYEPMGWG